MRTEQGFGILELLLVLTVGAILVVVALPHLQRYLALRDLEQTARLLGADLRLTQQYAVTQDEPYRLEYAAPQYTLRRISDGTAAKIVDVPATVTVTTSFPSNGVDFTATGAPVQTGVFCLTDGIATLKIEVLPATGRTQITEVSTCP